MVKCAICGLIQGERDCGKTGIGQPSLNFFKHKGDWYCRGCLMEITEPKHL